LSAEGAAFAGEDQNGLVVEQAQALPPCAVLFLFQPRLQVTIGDWRLRGDVDILRMERDAAGDLHVLITDMKSSTSAKVEHRLQVAFYHEMLAVLFADAGVAYADMGTAILYRGPAAGTAGSTPDEIARQEAQREQAAALLGHV
jgi:PD-(D/E)XK nuclease superfamily